ncbi:MAG: pilus assembly protein [Ornithinimicrobium sp.]|uniref:pilus assembly protein n=1 Tax=Ornithinimicrobium sp. TaxID=1977084 RepID=UPI0026E0A90C|nr:pilus assembly protein [Ornithinimicrobium sp.]MDO5740414.1 pilus assembly protein [Ornithinimicrobium sp.]
MTVEVAFLLVLLVVPLFYLIGTVGRVQAGAYAVSAAAREAGRGFVTAEDVGAAAGRAQAAAGLVFASHGFIAGEGTVELGCEGGDSCLTPGSHVVAEATITVPLPLVPDFMARSLPTAITLTAQHVETVDEFRESP